MKIEKIKEDSLLQGDPQKKQQLIQLGTEIIQTQQLQRNSIFNLFVSTFRFIRIQNWLIQLFTIGIGYFLTRYFAENLASTHELSIQIYTEGKMISTLTILVLFASLIFLEEILRSFTYGVWELEQTLKYDLRQHTLIKLIIFGLTEVILITLLALIVQSNTMIVFWQTALYLLVPFNSLCILLFLLISLFRNRLSKLVLWFTIFMIISVTSLLSQLISSNIYQLSMIIWLSLYSITTILLFGLLYSFFKKNHWEVS